MSKKTDNKFNEFIDKLKVVLDENSNKDNDFLIDLEYLKLLKHEGEVVKTIKIVK